MGQTENEFSDHLELKKGVTYWARCELDEYGILRAKEIRPIPVYVYVGPTNAPSLFPRFWKALDKICSWIRRKAATERKE